MLQEFIQIVSSVLDICCKCFIWMLFTHMLHVYIPNASAVPDVCCIKYFMLQVFHVSDVCLESHGGTARAPRDGGSAARFYWAARYRPMESYPIERPSASNSLLYEIS